jgi:hypothetical protein
MQIFNASFTLCFARLKSIPTPGFLRFVPFLPILAECNVKASQWQCWPPLQNHR